MNGDAKIDTAVSQLIHEIKSLKECCEKIIVEEISGEHMQSILKNINKEQLQVLMELLPLNTTLKITIPVIYDDIYWKRKCIAANWNYVHYWINNCSWRDNFIVHSVEEAIDNFLAKNTTFAQMTSDLEVFVDHLKRVKINGYKGNFTNEKKKSDLVSNVTSFEESVAKLFIFFPNLEEVYLNIAPVEYVVDNNEGGEEKENNLFKSISSMKRLTKLTIVGYSLKEMDVSILADYLVDSNVAYLNLAYNLLNDKCCVNLGNILNSPRLTTLVLSKNCIGDRGIKALLLVLCSNKFLQVLELSKNCITDDGGMVLAEFLKTNFFLRKLDISFNKLGFKSGMAFNNVLQSNSNLLFLNLTGNTLGQKVGEMFAESISSNKTILYLGVEFCGFGEKEEDIIYTRIHCNANTDHTELII